MLDEISYEFQGLSSTDYNLRPFKTLNFYFEIQGLLRRVRTLLLTFQPLTRRGFSLRYLKLPVFIVNITLIFTVLIIIINILCKLRDLGEEISEATCKRGRLRRDGGINTT